MPSDIKLSWTIYIKVGRNKSYFANDPLDLDGDNKYSANDICKMTIINRFDGLLSQQTVAIPIRTGHPMGHILDTGIRCFRAIIVGIVQLPDKGKFAKLRTCCQSLEKHLYFPREYFLIIMMGVQYKGFYLEQYSS